MWLLEHTKPLSRQLQFLFPKTYLEIKVANTAQCTGLGDAEINAHDWLVRITRDECIPLFSYIWIHGYLGY